MGENTQLILKGGEIKNGDHISSYMACLYFGFTRLHIAFSMASRGEKINEG